MKAYIALGSNIGDRRKTLSRAVELLAGTDGVSLGKVSALYRTEAVGGPPQADYLNGVVAIETHLTPKALLSQLLGIEQKMGRKRRVKWGPRSIDLDLLAYGARRIKQPGLQLPHPRYHERRFVLVPFCDVAPAYVHPRIKSRNKVLLRKLTPQGQRVTIAAQWNGTRFTPSKTRKRTKSRS